MKKTKNVIKHSAFALLILFMLAGLITAFPLLDSFDEENDIGETAEGATAIGNNSITGKSLKASSASYDNVVTTSYSTGTHRLNDGKIADHDIRCFFSDALICF